MGIYVNNDSIVTSGLVLYLDAANPKSYPGSGTTWNDLSGNGLNGTLSTGAGGVVPTYITNNAGSLSFDGIGSYVTLGNPSLLTPNTNPFTVEILVYPKNTGDFFCKDITGNAAWQWRMGFSGNNLYFIIGNASGSDSLYSGNYLLKTPNSLPLNIWRHITITRITTNYIMYLNGVQVAAASTTTNIDYSSSPSYYLGAQQRSGGLSAPLSGYISIFKQYNRNLSASEVQQNYNAQKSRFGMS